MGSTWDRVLRELAKDSQSTLVMHDIPPGHYTRQDLTEHTRTEAVGILNQQLEPAGFRILENDRYLTVLDMHRARSEYRRPVSPVTSTERRQVQDATAPTSSPTPQFTRPERQFSSISDDLRRDRAIVQTRAVGEGATIVTSGHEESAAALPTAGSPAVVDPKVRPEHRSAVDLARELYQSFRNRSELVDIGPNGLPAFRVYHRAPDPATEGLADRAVQGLWFTMEIDTDQNALHVTAPEPTIRGVLELVHRLDRPATDDVTTTRILQGTEATVHVGRQLQPELDRLLRAEQPRAASTEGGSGAADRRPANELAWQLTQNAPQPPAQAPEPAPQAPPDQPGIMQRGLPAILGGVRGPVTIEALDDLNLLILRGNEQDIEQVWQVIQAIEQLAVGTRPDIHLLFLTHVNSEALAELLTSVYEELANLRNVNAQQGAQTVNVIPVGTPNAILILAPQAAMESITDLARQLDQPADPQEEVDVFPLANAVASQVVALLEDFYEERAGLGPRVVVSADIRTNTVIVHARPRDLEEVRLIIRRIDRDQSRAASQLRVIPLKHAAADELAEFLTTTIQGIINPAQQQAAAGGFGAAATQGAQELRDTKAVVLEFLTTDGNAQRLIRSGLLSDVRVTADLRSNSVTVAAPQQTMKLMEELIYILDQPSATVAEIKVFQLEKADATTAVTLLTELFSSDDEDALGIAIAGAEDASSSLIPLRFSVDSRTNTVVAIGGAEALRVVEAVLLRLDESNLRQRQTTVLKLRNTSADSVATAINNFVQAQLDLVSGSELVSPSELIDQTFIVEPELTTNSLIISASPRYYDEILRLARELDTEPPQVSISALIVEVDLDDTDEFGIELGFQDPVLFNRSVMGVPGFLFNNLQLGNNTTSTNNSTVGSQGLSSFALGRSNADVGFGGLVLSASSESVSVLMRALQSRRSVRVLSRPSVQALDNLPALIQDGQSVPIVSGVNVTGFTTSPNIQYQDTGLILTVTPRITPEGQVVMLVSAQKSSLSDVGVPVFIDANNGSVIEAPIIDQTIAETTVKVQDGQTVVLGGIIVEADGIDERKVPWLGDLPVIGHAFRYDSNSHRRSELLVFITPRIVHDDADFELIKQVETERIHFFEHEAEAVHGPLFSVPMDQFAPENGYSMPYGDGAALQGVPLPGMPLPPADVEGPVLDLTPGTSSVPAGPGGEAVLPQATGPASGATTPPGEGSTPPDESGAANPYVPPTP
jgi:type II secretion system protein D